MDLHKTVDFARNFSVMIRVQGPDPKGLKMRKHAFHHYNSGKTTLSASGMLLPNSFYDPALANKFFGNSDTQAFQGSLVLTVASVIEPFISLQHRENISQGKHDLIPGSEIDIMVEGKMVAGHGTEVLDQEAPRWLPAKFLTLVEIPVSSSSVQSLIEGSGSSEHGWEVGWSLASYSNSPQPSIDSFQTQQSSMTDKELRNPNLMGKSTTRIAILGVSSLEDPPKLNILCPSKRGDLFLAMGSPFGILSPLHFFNSISVGSIANCYPAGSSNRSLYMADVRCLPGMEGSPVFGEHAQLIGILTRPLQQKTTGAEIQLLIPWEAIATACSDLLQQGAQSSHKASFSNGVKSDGSLDHIHEHPNAGYPPPSLLEKAMASTCLVTIDGGVWASGVLLNNQGLILTNAHLLEPWRFGKATANGEINEFKSNGDECGRYKFNLASISYRRSIRIRLDHMDPWIWCDARVVYVSKGPLDVALLQLEFVPDELCPIVMDFTCPSVGSKAYIIGHGLFGPRCDFFPSVCIGVVAKVVKAKRPLAHQSNQQQRQFPAMIETTAAVHPGGSGGAVVNSDGHMIGLVTSNARHGGGTVIPHLNFSIPCAALGPIFKFSKDTKDFSLLEELEIPNEHLSSVWALLPPLSPKPAPSLPNLPPLPQGDNNNEIKGSRFAKFIAERHDLLKKNSQFNKVESLSSKFIPNVDLFNALWWEDGMVEEE
ncbi:hypothetical protein LguiB_034062 [Lonicera macranthoides]